MDRVFSELPRFFSAGNVWLLLQGMGTTLALTLIGCVLGFLLAFAVVYVRQTPGWWAVPMRLVAVAMSRSSAAFRSSS